jgi:hypothetical protein
MAHTITIKTAYRSNGNQYWFAVNIKNRLFQYEVTMSEQGFLGFVENENTKFESLEDLESKLKSYFERILKPENEPKTVKTLEF